MTDEKEHSPMMKGRPSVGAASTASTAAPTGRPSDMTGRPSNLTGRPSDMSVPLIGSVATDKATSSPAPSVAGSMANLVPRAASFIGQPAGLPCDSVEERLAGLTTADVEERLREFGKNEIPEQVDPWYMMLGRQFVGMMPFMLELAAILSAVGSDWADLTIILLMLVLNALIGFHEETKAKQSLDALKAQMTATVPVKRDGNMVIRPVAELVPGDIIFLRGGNVVPADCEFIEGDQMLVDTAALTGEPIPRKVPRPDREGEAPGAGRQLLSGCIIKQGEGHCEVKLTGLRTELGQAAGLVQEASGHQVGVFETKIMQVVRAVILITLVNALVVLFVDHFVRGSPWKDSLIGMLALVIGAVPIALPLVMQVTMAIGAAKMAGHSAIVTHLTALQEIASMTVLCSDKTGTLTTADMRVLPQRIWTRANVSKDDALVWAGVASNPANKEDPIDKAVLESVNEHFGAEGQTQLAKHKKEQFIGFNPTVKRTVVYCDHPEHGKLKIAKGLIDKVLVTGDDGGDCWECENAEGIRGEIKEIDKEMSLQGYKTVGVAVAKGKGPMEFVGIVPIIDPPREDTKLTIFRIRQAGIGVKMITGDHLNIAVETSRLIGLGTGVLPASDLWPASATRDETVLTADGFAQVLPKDKREVILVLQNHGLVVGMTGDGVNDAPALAQAQIGIAVDGATEAARSAADIILTTPGLTAIFDAVSESRKIFARLRAYVLYRVAATIQIVIVLSVLIYAYNDPLPALYVILLALLNDITMLPIADDRAVASATPEIPTMPDILLASAIYGALETCQTIGLYLSGWLQEGVTDAYRSAVIYLQISMAIELLIFSCRTPGFLLFSRPSTPLIVAVLGANILVSLLAGFGNYLDNAIIHKVSWGDIAWIWLYDIAGLLVIDACKTTLRFFGIGWMSAGAAGGVLGYPELPAEAGTSSSSAHSRSQLLSRTNASNASSVSALRSSQRSVLRSGAQKVLRSWAPEPRSTSTLPYPYNLRADALHFMNVRRTSGSF